MPSHHSSLQLPPIYIFMFSHMFIFCLFCRFHILSNQNFHLIFDEADAGNDDDDDVVVIQAVLTPDSYRWHIRP